MNEPFIHIRVKNEITGGRVNYKVNRERVAKSGEGRIKPVQREAPPRPASPSTLGSIVTLT